MAETESSDSKPPTSPSTVSEEVSKEQEQSPNLSFDANTKKRQPPGPVLQQFVPAERIFQLKRRPSPFYTPHFNYSDLVFFSVLLFVTVLAIGTRLYKLNEPTHVA